MLALFKSMLTLIYGARYSFTTVPRKPFGFGVTNYDPLRIIPIDQINRFADVSKSFKALDSVYLNTVILIILLSIIILLIMRWLATAWFLNKVVEEGHIANELNELLRKLSIKLKIKIPRLIITEREIGPLSIGIMKPTIVLPKTIVNQLKNSEIEVILGHELAHLKRKDNYFQWVILFMKDLLFFNPFVKLPYERLQLYKEQAADNLFLKVMPHSNRLLQKTLNKVSSILTSNKPINLNIRIAKAHFVNDSMIGKRLQLLQKRELNYITDTFISRVLSIICILLFFWTQIWIAVKLGKKALLLIS